MKTKKTETQLTNRILINLGIGALAYTWLYILYAKLYMQNFATFLTAGIFAVAAVVLYVLSAKTGKYRNYAHMLVAFVVALLFTRLAYITAMLFGGHNLMALVESSYFWKMVFNTQKEVMAISLLGGVYLAGMLIYNCVLIAKTRNPKKKK